MSAIRERRIGTKWEQNEVDLYTSFTGTPSVTSITNMGAGGLRVNISDPNTAVTLYDVKRSVDGGPFMFIFETPPIITWVTDDFFLLTAPLILALPDGTQYQTDPTLLAYPVVLTLPFSPTFAPPLVPVNATVPFDTIVYTLDLKNTFLIAAGTLVTIQPGFSSVDITAPVGHSYAYEVASKNSFETSAYGSSASITPPSSFTAITLNAPTRTNNKITLTWTDPNTYSTGQLIEVWKEVGASGFSLLTTIIKTTAPMPTTYVDAFDFLTLVPATYSYKLRPRDLTPAFSDTGPYSNTQSIVVSFTLSAVSSSATTLVTTSHIQTTWTDPNSPANEAGLQVERQAGTGAFNVVGSVAPGVLTFDDFFQTEPGQTYTYRITPFNSLHYGPPSNTSSPNASVTAPLLIPTLQTVIQTADIGAVVNWTDLNTHQANYDIQRSINGGAFSTVGTVAGTMFTFADTFSANLGDTIAYKVRARNPATSGTYSNVVSLAIHRTLEAPSQVAAAVVDPVTIQVTWNDTNTGQRGVSLYRSIGGASFTLLATLPKNTTSYTDATPLVPLVPGQTYSYQVSDFNNQEISALSNIGTIVDPFRGPTNLQVTGVVLGVATLTWVDNATPFDITEVEMQFTGGPFTKVGQVQRGTQTFQVSVNGGTPGGLVTFRVREVRSAFLLFGNSPVAAVIGDYSQIASTATPLLAPTSVTVTRPSPAFNLITWTDPNVLSTGYQIYRSISYGGGSTPYDFVGGVTLPAPPNFQDFVPAADGITFSYKVLATNAVTTSPLSSAGSFTARFNTPGLTVVQTQRRGMFLTVTAPVPYTFVAGDMIIIQRSVNGGPATTLTTASASFPFMYLDNAINIGDRVSYVAFLTSSNEHGPLGGPVIKTVEDVVPLTLGAINQLRISGSRNTLLREGVFVACAGGIAKVTTDLITFEPIVTTQTSALVANSKSIVSGDLVRVVAFTDNTSLTGKAVTLDAQTLGIVGNTPLTFSFSTGGIWGWGSEQVQYDATCVSGQYIGGSDGNYLGWALATVRTSFLLSPPVDFSPYPPETVYTQWIGGLGAPLLEEPVLHPEATPSPNRYENLGGDLIFFTYNPATDTSSPFRVTLSLENAGQPTPFDSFKGRVIDFVSDGSTRIYGLLSTGGIFLLDFTKVPSFPTFGVVAKTPFLTGTSSTFSLGAIEVAIDKKVVASISYIGVTNGIGAHRTDLFTFDIPINVSTSTPIKLADTFTVDEYVTGVAFDGESYFFASSQDTNKLYRFNIGF